MGKYLLLYALLQEITVKLALAVLQIASLHNLHVPPRYTSQTDHVMHYLVCVKHMNLERLVSDIHYMS